MTPTQRARVLATALEIIDGTICQCGHHESEHHDYRPDGARMCVDGCRCRSLRLVRFVRESHRLVLDA